MYSDITVWFVPAGKRQCLWRSLCYVSLCLSLPRLSLLLSTCLLMMDNLTVLAIVTKTEIRMCLDTGHLKWIFFLMLLNPYLLPMIATHLLSNDWMMSVWAFNLFKFTDLNQELLIRERNWLFLPWMLCHKSLSYTRRVLFKLKRDWEDPHDAWSYVREACVCANMYASNLLWFWILPSQTLNETRENDNSDVVCAKHCCVTSALLLEVTFCNVFCVQ